MKQGTTWHVLGVLVVLVFGSLNGSLSSAQANPLAQGNVGGRQPATGLTAILPTQGGPGGTRDNPLLNPCTGRPFTTIMTGAGLQNIQVRPGGIGNSQYVINFSLADNEEARRFSQYTATHIGQPLAIVIDGQVLSAPIVQAALTTGGEITGNFTLERAQELAVQLRYGALPVPLVVVTAARLSWIVFTVSLNRPCNCEDSFRVYVPIPYVAFKPITGVTRSFATITDGSGVVLAAAPGAPVGAEKMEQARQIIISRINALGVTDPVVRLDKDNQIVVELRGVRDIQTALEVLKATGFLEFVDFSKTGSCTAPMPVAGQYILTDRPLGLPGVQPTPGATDPVATVPATPAATLPATTPATESPATVAAATAPATAAATPEAQGAYSQIPQATTADGAPILGDPAAKVLFVEFGDYSCPHCAAYQPIIHQVIDQYVRTGQAQLIFRPQTFVGGDYSKVAAQAALCAGKQQHFWEMADALFELQASSGFEAFAPDVMKATADDIGINGSEVAACIERGDTASTLDSSDQLAETMNITGVPSVLYSTDGVKFNWLPNPDSGDPITSGGPPFASYTRVIQQLYPAAQ